MSKKEPKEPREPKKGKAPKEAAPQAEPQEKGKKAKPRGPQEPPRLRVRYSKEVVPALMKHFNYKNIMAVPKLEKIVINMGLGEAIANAKILDVAVDELGRIAGQRPVITRAKKSIANFKLRQHMPIGAAVTLRGERMFEFLDRLVSIVLPRVRDFRGVSTKSFDGRGNYTLGLRDQLIFPEIPYEKVDKIRGMNVTVVTTARTDDEARELLKQLGMPFRQQ
ncbi:MAG TPA: 50S ribosomal protein L5 [Terriglobia bacterium]|nr:50S ribosomal protein L5 [Terriglobia bacterium]